MKLLHCPDTSFHSMRQMQLVYEFQFCVIMLERLMINIRFDKLHYHFMFSTIDLLN